MENIFYCRLWSQKCEKHRTDKRMGSMSTQVMDFKLLKENTGIYESILKIEKWEKGKGS